MKSCLYECQVMHARLAPKQHRFAYRMFYFAIDLDELPLLDQSLTLLSVDARNLYSFRDADFLPTGDAGSLKARVITLLQRHSIATPVDRVTLISLPRVLGYLFNPVSFYFAQAADGTPIAAIAEVTNTFRETKPYVLTQFDGAAFELRVPKNFYVSPFSDVDVQFHFRLPLPGQALALHVDDYAGDERTLISTLSGEARELTNRRLTWFTLKYPLITVKVIALIHWHALRLWLKRLPWFAKNARPEDQRDLLNPHPSIKPKPQAP